MAQNPFEKALADEGLVGTPLESLARSIYMQESGGGRNTKTSNAGAVGGMQILPGTFQEVLPGGDINDPYQNSVAGLRYIKKLSGMAGGDPSLVAAGYYGGPGGMQKAKQGVAVRDPRNPNAPDTLQYAKQVTERQGKTVSRETPKAIQENIANLGEGYQAAYALMSMADEEPETEREREAKEAQEEQSAAQQFAAIQKQLASVKPASPFAAQGSEQVQEFAEGGDVAKDAQGSSGGFERFVAKTIGVDKAWDKSLEAPYEMGLSEDSGTRGDAVRHMTLMREIEKKYNPTVAKTLGYAHEFIGGPMQYFSNGEPQSSRDREMDLRNNALGLELSKQAGGDDAKFKELMRQALENKQADFYREEYTGKRKAPGATQVRKRAEGSPEEGETKSTAKEMLKEVGRSTQYLPYDLLGAPVDVINLGLKGIDYVTGSKLASEKPVGGSDYLIEKSRQMGIADKPTGSLTETLTRFGTGLVTPGGVVKAGQMATRPVTAAKKMLDEIKPEPRVVPETTSIPTQALPEAPPAFIQVAPTPAPPAAPVRAPKVESAVRAPIQVSAERPYVGGVEQIIADKLGDAGKGTVAQIRGMIAKSGREHDIARLDQAIAGMNPNDKVTAKDLLAKLETSSPARYKMDIVEPGSVKDERFFHKEENPRQSTNAFGVVRLLQDIPEQTRATQKIYDKASEDLSNLSTSIALSEQTTAKALASFEDFLNTNAVDPQLTKGFAAFKPDIQDLLKQKHELESDKFAYSYPTLHAKNYGYDYSANYQNTKKKPAQMDMEAEKAIVSGLTNKYGSDVTDLINSEEFIKATQGQKGVMMEKLIAEKQGARLNDVKEQIRDYLKPYSDFVRTKQKNEGYYKGDPIHNAVATDENPIGFSRFIDVELPNKQNVMVYSELQSDRLDDLRKVGPKGGSVQKDQEELASLRDKLAEARSKFEEAQYISDTSKDAKQVAKANKEMDALRTDILRIEGRSKQITNRNESIFKKNEYYIEEAFPGMETSPGLVQQLMIKNGVIAGVQRGKNGVLFPGSDSKQAQVYENIANNVKAALKDLGPGFEIRTVPFETENAGVVNRVGVFWDEKAAQRLQKQGVRFAKGGFVEKKY